MELTAQLSGNVSNHPFRRRQSSPPPSSTITSDFQIPKPLSGNHSKKFRRQTSTRLSSDPIFKMRPSSLLTSITPSLLWEDVLSVFLHLSTLKSPVLRSTLKQWLMLWLEDWKARPKCWRALRGTRCWFSTTRTSTPTRPTISPATLPTSWASTKVSRALLQSQLDVIAKNELALIITINKAFLLNSAHGLSFLLRRNLVKDGIDQAVQLLHARCGSTAAPHTQIDGSQPCRVHQGPRFQSNRSHWTLRQLKKEESRYPVRFRLRLR